MPEHLNNSQVSRREFIQIIKSSVSASTLYSLGLGFEAGCTPNQIGKIIFLDTSQLNKNDRDMLDQISWENPENPKLSLYCDNNSIDIETRKSRKMGENEQTILSLLWYSEDTHGRERFRNGVIVWFNPNQNGNNTNVLHTNEPVTFLSPLKTDSLEENKILAISFGIQCPIIVLVKADHQNNLLVSQIDEQTFDQLNFNVSESHTK